MSEQATAAPVTTAAPTTTQAPSTTDATQSQSQGATAQSATNAKTGSSEPIKAPELYEVKVNGQTRKMTLEQLKASALLAQGAHEKFQTAAEKEKKYNDWKQKAQQDALSALMDPELGLTREQIKQKFEGWYKENFIDPEMMNEDQRRAKEFERKAKEYEQKLQKIEEQERIQAQEKQQEAARNQVQQEIIQVLEKSGLPKTRFTANRLAFWMKQNLMQGYEAPVEVLTEQVKEESKSIIQSQIAQLEPDQLIAYLGDIGETLIQKLRKWDLARLKKQVDKDGIPKQQPTKSAEKKHKTMSDVDSYFNELRRSKR